MRKYSYIYYLLFILLVTGAFASMAQNSYGIKIMGGVAFAFGFVFGMEFISLLQKKNKKDIYLFIEPGCLFILSFLSGCRTFTIHFPFIALLFGAAGILLGLFYLRKMIQRFRFLQPKNKWLAVLSFFYHGSIILFIISLVLFTYAPGISAIAGIGGFVLLLTYILAGFLKRDQLTEGEKVSVFGMAKQFKDHSIIILSLFLLFSLYLGLNKMGMIPGIYTDEYPQAYYKLVNEAESGKEKRVDGKFKYEIFKEKYDLFLQHNKGK